MKLRKFYKEEGAYTLPRYQLEKEEGLVEIPMRNPLVFVSGENSPYGVRFGIVTEGLLAALIDHLNELNVGELRNRHTSIAITKLEEALFWIEERKRDRKERNVSGTNKA